MKTLILATALLTAASVQAAEMTMTARITPQQVALGEDAQLQLTITGDSGGRPRLPAIDGLTIVPSGQSQQMTIVNGKVDQRITYLFTVSPTRTGQLTIPAMRLGNAETEPLSLEVTNGRAPVPQQASASPSAPNVRAMAHLNLPKKSLTVGESERVSYEAYFLPGTEVTITGQPTVSGGAFLLGDVSSKPRQTQTTIGGQPYIALSWSATLTAVKSGTYPLVAAMPVTVRYRQETRQRMPDLFGDDDFFKRFDLSAFTGGRVQQKELTLTTAALTTEVTSLPPNAPAGFAGAVGQFAVSARVADGNVMQGDPITLHIEVSGKGNFERVASPGVQASIEWKTYAPSSHFTAEGSPLTGHKVFEQAVVPLRAGNVTLPPLAFTYFDPVAHKYVSKRTPPLHVNVAANGTSQAPIAFAPVAPAAVAPVAAASDGLAANANELGSVRASLQPLFLRPWFLASSASAPALLAAAAFLLRRKRSVKTVNAKQARAALHTMDNAAVAKDAPAFFRAARQALQCSLADTWSVAPESITQADIEARIGGDNDLQTVFTMADATLYTGKSLPVADLGAWQARVRDQLRYIKQEVHS